MQHRSHLALAALAVAMLASGCGGDDDRPKRAEPNDEPAITTPADAPPISTTATPEQIRSQDRETPQQRREQLRAMRERPLQQALPLRINRVTIDIAGLAEDGKRTRIVLDADGRSREDAERLFADVLDAYGDRASNYELEVKK